MIRMADPFVILLHTGWRADHYDLMLRRGEALATWELSADPAGLAAGATTAALRLPDHRLAYLEYEGPVSGERGEVRRVHSGTFETTAHDADMLGFRIRSGPCRGRWELRRQTPHGDAWTLTRVRG